MRITPIQTLAVTLEGTEGRLHALAFERSKKRRSSKHITHTWSGCVPPGSFYRLSNDVYIASPEFVFLGAASKIDTVSLIALGDELCGLYAFDCRAERGMRKREVPIVTSECLFTYLESARGCPGYREAKRALSHVVDLSASPMETFDEMTMCLPYRFGGYGLRKPKMNQLIRLNEQARLIARRSVCYADMLWEECMLDVEHHGRYDHSSAGDALSDRSRVNGLREMGYEVIELTKPQVDDLAAYELIVRRIAKLMGKRLRPEQLGATPPRLALRQSLKSWNASYGRLC